MAVASRSARLVAGRRWIVAGVVLTILVLLVDASIKSRSPGPVRQLAGQAWVDRVLPIIADSTTEGAVVAHVRGAGASMSTTQVVAELNQVASEAAASYKRASSLTPPAGLRAADGFLKSCLVARSRGAATMASAVSHALSSPSSSAIAASATAVAAAGGDFASADRAYRRFASRLVRSGGVKAPSSVWLAHGSAYSVSSSTAYLDRLRSTGNTVPVHRVDIVAVSTHPSAVTQTTSSEILPTAKVMSVTVVLADVGNQVEKNLTVTASISPSAGASSARAVLTLGPGAAKATTIGPLDPPAGRTVTLDVSVTPANGSPTPSAARSVVFRMPLPPPASTTTSVAKSTPTSGGSHS